MHYGCVPSKALITAAKEVHHAYEASKKFGLKIEGKTTIADAMKRVKDAINHIQEHDSKERFQQLGVVIYEGKGSFINDYSSTNR